MEAAKIFFNVKAPDDHRFRINYFRGVERISDLFHYELIMTAESATIDFDSMVGKSVTVSVKIRDIERTYNGIIGLFEQDDTPFLPLGAWTTYRAVLYPNLWLLNFSGQCRIFQNKTTLDIIREVLDEAKIKHSNKVTSSGMQEREFCVQYNETNLNFISRLMEEVGIFYFFEQTKEGHTLVLADSPESHLSCPNAETASFHDAADRDQFLQAVTSCFITQRIVPKSNTLKSYNYLTPKTPLKALSEGAETTKGGALTSYHQIYDQHSLGDSLVQVRLESEDFPQKMVEGISTVPFFLAGYKFRLEGHPRVDANLDYVLYEVVHEVRLTSESPEEPLYNNSYKGFLATIPFRPAQKTPKPRIYGTQTAKVTGKTDEEIYTEEYGRIKVKFHWDPSEKDDETTSCWIRVVTLWSGQGWGTLFTPRIGHEVVVSFIDGNPDLPLVVGSVYNGENKPPYLPSDPTKSTIKSQTSKKEGEETPGYNELRFEDKKGSEEIYMHAQKDFKIDIQNNHDITIVGGNRTIVLQSKEESQEERAGEQSNDSLKLINGNKSLQIDKGNYTITLNEGNISVTCAKGNVDFDVTGNISFKCTGNFSVDASENISLKAGQMISAEAGSDITGKAGAAISTEAGADISAKAGAGVTVEAGADISATAGAAVEVSGSADVSVEAGGALELTGGGTATLEGATVEITGSVVILNG